MGEKAIFYNITLVNDKSGRVFPAVETLWADYNVILPLEDWIISWKAKTIIKQKVTKVELATFS